MPVRRPSGYFWNNVQPGANAFSDVARTGWGYDNFALFLSVGGPTVITLLIANDVPDKDQQYYTDTTSIFYPAFYLDTELKWSFANADSIAVLVPDFTPLYARLKNSAGGVTVTASWLGSGD